MSPVDLFAQADETVEPGKATQPVADVPNQLNPESKLSATMGPYMTYMRSQGLSENTIKAFKNP